MKIKIGIIGALGHIHTVVDGIRENPEIVCTAIAKGSEEDDLTQLKAELAQVRCFPKFYEDYHELLQQEKLDAVAVDARFDLHASITMEAFQHVDYVYCEKPLATTMEDFQKLCAVRKPHQILWSMATTRYDPWFYTAYCQVKAGAIGKIRMMNARKSYRLGTRPDFYRSRSTYGGTISWVGIHGMDWMRLVCDEPLTSVDAYASCQDNPQGNFENSAVCMFRFENEVFGTLSIDFLRPDSMQVHDDDCFRIAGTKGILQVEKKQVYLLTEPNRHPQQLTLIQPPYGIFADFARAVQGAEDGLLNTEISLETTHMSLVATQSADQNRRVILR